METSNFSLKQSIEDYIALIKGRGSISSSDAAELAVHLYDTTTALKQFSLSEEEAFIIARKRLGNEEELHMEYSKVNSSITTNTVWAYLFIGFNWLFSIFTILYIGVALFYRLIYNNIEGFFFSSMIVTAFNIMICVCAWCAIAYKNSISKFIEKRVTNNPIHSTFLSFLLLAFVFVLEYNLRHIDLFGLLFYAEEKFNSLAEFSFNIIFLNIALLILSLVFSIHKIGKPSFKMFFEKPSPLFLVIFGVVVELIAACTRALIYNNIFLVSLAFGLVYLLASFCIVYYSNKAPRHLLIFSVFGLFCETFFGIIADISRGNTYNTIYFVSALFTGVILGWFLAMRGKRRYTLSHDGEHKY